MFKNTKMIVAACALSFATVAPVSVAHAQDAVAAKIAVVNIQAIMRDSTAAKSVRSALESKQKAYQAEISKTEQALQKEDQDLAQQRSALSKEAFEAKVKAFRDKATVAQKDVQQKKIALDKAFETSLAEIQSTSTKIIADLAKEKGFVVALPTSQILYAEPGMDISDEVLTRLNKQLPRVNVKF